MPSRRLTIIEVGFIALVGLAVLTWFRGDTILTTSASVWPLDWHMFLQKTLSIWDDSVVLGSLTARQVAFLPWASLGAAAESLGVPASLWQKILIYVWFTGSGLAMWWLCVVCGFGRLVRMVAALFYMVNPYALVVIWSQSDGLFMPFYMGVPLGLALFLVTVWGQRGWGVMWLAHGLLLLSLSIISFSNPALAVVFWLPCLMALAGLIISDPKRWRGILRAAGRFGLIWLAVNAFWLVPLLSAIQDQFIAANHLLYVPSEDPGRVLRDDRDTFGLNSVRAVDALRLTGLWSVTASYGPDPYYVWAGLMTAWPAWLLSFLIPSLLIIGWWRNPDRPAVIFFGCIFVAAFWLVLGVYPPLSETRLELFTGLPALLRAFRAVFSKFGVLLALGAAPLIGLGVEAIYHIVRRLVPRLAMLIVGLLGAALIGVGGWPVWSGNVIHPGGQLLQPGRVRIPEFYNSLKNWSENQSGVWRMLSLPLAKTGATALRWENSGYIGSDFIRWFSPPHPVLMGLTANPAAAAVPQTIAQESFLSPLGGQKLLGLLNIKYVLRRHDFHWPANANGMMFNNKASIDDFAGRSWLTMKQRWGDLELKQPTDNWLPKIYAAKEPVTVVGAGIHVFDALSLDVLPWPTALLIWPDSSWSDGPIVITTSTNEEKLVRARQELSEAQVAQQPEQGELAAAIQVLKRSVDTGQGVSLLAPRADNYEVAVARWWLNDQSGKVEVTITDAAGRRHYLKAVDSERAVDSGHYQPLGMVTLPPGNFRLETTIDGHPAGSIMPGTFILYTSMMEAAAPTVDFQQQSPTAYSVTTRGSARPFLLVFSEAYHQFWQLSVRQPDGSWRPVPAAQHVPVNGYANGWWIDDPGDGGMMVTFSLQRYLWLGLAISGVALGAGGLWVVWAVAVGLFRRRRRWYSFWHAA